jgi:hypothetical protein
VNLYVVVPLNRDVIHGVISDLIRDGDHVVCVRDCDIDRTTTSRRSLRFFCNKDTRSKEDEEYP